MPKPRRRASPEIEGLRVGQVLLRVTRTRLADLAGCAGVTVSHVSSVLSGRFRPSRRVRKRIEDRMGMPLADLLKPAAGTVVAVDGVSAAA